MFVVIKDDGRLQSVRAFAAEEKFNVNDFMIKHKVKIGCYFFVMQDFLSPVRIYLSRVQSHSVKSKCINA